jgi:hypothetical protein
MKEKTWFKPVLSMLCIVAGGFILFNVAFMLAALTMGALARIDGTQGIPPAYGRIIFVILIFILSWFIFRSKLNDLFKATYLTMPLMIALVMIGIFSFQLSQWVVYILGGVVVAAVLYFIYLKKLSWLYYFATGYVVAVALFVMIAGIEI